MFANVENNRLYMNKEALRWPHPDRMVVFQTRYISYNASTHTQTQNILLYGCYGNQSTLLFIRTDIVLARNSKSLDFLMRFMYIRGSRKYRAVCFFFSSFSRNDDGKVFWKIIEAFKNPGNIIYSLVVFPFFNHLFLRNLSVLGLNSDE